jgi:ABC-type antimicrobial peptide transport system permease subunit
VRIRGDESVAAAGDASVRVNQVSEGYSEALGIRLLRGRLLRESDSAGALRVALVNEMAARYFTARDPIGQFLVLGGKGAVENAYQVVGVVADTKHRSLREPSPPMVFIPTRQSMQAERRVTLVVASTSRAGSIALLEPIRRRLADVESGLLISEVLTLHEQVESTLLAERLLSGLSATFGVLAVLLAGIGLYGVLGYRISRQRRSIGIRMALGASPASIAAGVLRQSATVIAAGLICGLPFAFLAARAADSMLWGVTSSDFIIYVSGVALLSLIGLGSSVLPAGRASRIEPAETLRHD